MNPDRHLTSHWDYYGHLVQGDDDSAEAHRRFYDEYNAVLDMPAEYYLDTVKTVFQDFALPKGRMFVGDELVRPQAIRSTALLTIEGELDDISGNGQTEAAHALCLNIPRERRAHFLAPGVGHYGIFSGRRWREMVFPQVRDFIQPTPERLVALLDGAAQPVARFHHAVEQAHVDAAVARDGFGESLAARDCARGRRRRTRCARRRRRASCAPRRFRRWTRRPGSAR